MHVQKILLQGCFRFKYNWSSNTAFGRNALTTNTTGNSNTVGKGCLALATTASNNTAVGLEALLNNTTGSQNVLLVLMLLQIIQLLIILLWVTML